MRLRRLEAARDPEAAPTLVTLPAAWDDTAACALAVLAEGAASVDLPSLAERWLAKLAGGPDPTLAGRAHAMLLGQQGAPEQHAWNGSGRPGRYRLNLGAFAAGLGQVDEAALRGAALDAMDILVALWPERTDRILVLTGLDALLAATGLDYASAEARSLAAGVSRMLHACPSVERLAAGAPDPVDALLGLETGGIAPAFAPIDAWGRLSRAALARLAVLGMSAEAALAASLCGESPLPIASAADHAAMSAALEPLLDEWPALPAALPRPVTRRELPRRRGGVAQRATVGGQRVHLTTGEFADGTLGEVSIGLPQAGPAARALAECLSQAIGIGLQHGAPLSEFIEALVGTRFGASGPVEGDPDIGHASSPADYVGRALAAAYLPDLALPPSDGFEDGSDHGEAARDPRPLLPLELPRDARARRRGLRVVA